jgi:hypothetical protein
MITREEIRELAQFQAAGDATALSFYFQPQRPQNKSHREEAILAKDLARKRKRTDATEACAMTSIAFWTWPVIFTVTRRAPRRFLPVQRKISGANSTFRQSCLGRSYS